MVQYFQICKVSKYLPHFSFSKGIEGCALPICGSKPRKQEIMDITGNRFDTRKRGSLGHQWKMIAVNQVKIPGFLHKIISHADQVSSLHFSALIPASLL